MLGDFGNVGWDLPDDDRDGDSQNNGMMTAEENLFKFRFKMPDSSKNPINVGKPVTHRILMLNDAPFRYYEHGLFRLQNMTKHFTAICLKKNNGIDKRGCPLCDIENWPAFVGLFSIIDLGQIEYSGIDITLHHSPWTDKDGKVHANEFPKKILAAKKGSKRNPGVLIKLAGKAERYGGSFEGTVWDTTRTGDKEAGIGEDWEYVERVAPEDYVKYLVKYGADPYKLDVNPITNWLDICKPLSYEELCKIVGKPVNNGNQYSNNNYNSGHGGSYYDDDTPPF